jgi:hypothetical protein
MWHNEKSHVPISLRHFAIFICLLALGTAFAQAQGARMPDPIPNDPRADEGPQDRSPLVDMMVKRRIRLEEKQYQENIDRAREAAQIGAELHAAFSNSHHLTESDFKKLDRLEKITKKIREEVGGSNGDGIPDKVPTDVQSALERIDCVADTLKARMEKTPRMVVSAAVIDTANELLDLIKIVRNFGQPQT